MKLVGCKLYVNQRVMNVKTPKGQSCNTSYRQDTVSLSLQRVTASFTSVFWFFYSHHSHSVVLSHSRQTLSEEKAAEILRALPAQQQTHTIFVFFHRRSKTVQKKHLQPSWSYKKRPESKMFYLFITTFQSSTNLFIYLLYKLYYACY